MNRSENLIDVVDALVTKHLGGARFRQIDAREGVNGQQALYSVNLMPPVGYNNAANLQSRAEEIAINQPKIDVLARGE